MKFQVSMSLEFKAASISEAGEKVNALVEQAEADHAMETKLVDLRTPPTEASPPPAVILPSVTPHDAPPGPRAENLSVRG